MKLLFAVAVVLLLGGWLLVILWSGELRVKQRTTRRKDEPGMFWLSWGLLFALFVASLLSLLGIAF